MIQQNICLNELFLVLLYGPQLIEWKCFLHLIKFIEHISYFFVFICLMSRPLHAFKSPLKQLLSKCMINYERRCWQMVEIQHLPEGNNRAMLTSKTLTL